ncbi:swr complex subunit [Ascosphaera aggregata]|nr:swr complex subunit [Ascosphaera aggregata]
MTAADDDQPSKEDEVDDKVAPTFLDEDDDYNSEDDPDFDINKPVEESCDEPESEEEDDDDENDIPDVERPRKRQRETRDNGDETTKVAAPDDRTTTQTAMEQTQKEARRKGAKIFKASQKDGDSSDLSDDDVGGEGGLIKTRAQKLREKEEKRRLIGQGKVTVDVDALWERLNSQPILSTYQLPPKTGQTDESVATRPGAAEGGVKGFSESVKNVVQSAKAITLPDEENITIRRVYKFAGETITEERVVPRNSAAAKLYLASADAVGAQLGKAGEVGSGKAIEIRTNENGDPLIRPRRRLSRFDPNLPNAFRKGRARGAVASKEVASPDAPSDTKAPATTDDSSASKLSTVSMSRMDWATYIDESGIQEELETHSRAKEGYLNRMDFLSRVDQKQELERRKARMKAS